jgi:hypothetical protein
LNSAPSTDRPAGPPALRALDPSLAAAEIAIVAWLAYACASYVVTPLRWWPDLIWLSPAAVACSWSLGLHQRPPVPGLGRLLVRTVALAPVLAVLLFVDAALQGPQIGPALALWMGAAAAVLFLLLRLGFWAAASHWPDRPLEMARWLAVGAAGVALLLPFYGRHGFGSGDVYWYVVMLADMIAQVHRGIFPVWVGQSPYAFTGAVSPLRLAPLFQYSGALLDLLTFHALEPQALANAVISASGLAVAASSYFCVRFALPQRPNLACLLALLWLLGPGVLAPLYSGFQFMEWVAMPFVPILLFGCWRLWARDDGTARLAIVVGVAGMTLGHTPTGLWGGLLGAGMYLAHTLARRHWPAEARRIPAMLAGFLVLGGFAVGSAITIDHAARVTGDNQRWLGYQGVFPDDFLPINIAVGGIKTYQLGYTLLAAGLLAIGLLAWLRPRGAAAFIGAQLAFAVLLVPVTGLTDWVWSHVPPLVIAITNSPTQRLFEFWSGTVVFALVLAVSQPRLGRRPWAVAVLAAGLAGGGVWSAQQARLLVGALHATFAEPGEVAISLRPENLQLARYAYATFAEAPGYASHAHVDPELENRLLERDSLKVIAANADAAAPRVQPDSDLDTLPRLAQAGLWVATSFNHQRIYQLSPALRLEPGQRYALRLEFLQPDRAGVLQIANHDLFREYLLPDSGVGIASVPLAFGSLPSSSHVAALEQRSAASRVPEQKFVAPIFAGEQFDFARFWLFTYESSNLPVRVTSWIPYRAEVETAIPSYLETPRIWQRGWSAKVNGRAVADRESPQHLVMVPLEPGTSKVELTFQPPRWLAGWFWLCLAGWGLLAGGGIGWLGRRAGLT